MAPQGGVNGVLPVSALQKNAPASAPRGPKAQQPKLKLVLRRLPPGLTKPEFESALGDEWKLGAGKVDWLVYKEGKISKDAAKPSRPSIAYLHVTAQSHVIPLGDYVRRTAFNDAAKSTQDSALAGPPTLQFAPYPRMPGGRKKHDSRQGTIDQDQEFKDFLESLTNPISKPAGPETEEKKETKVTTTPLIEALREKKANKDKPQPKATKHGRGEAKEDGTEKTEKKILTKGAKDTPAASGEKGRRPTKAERAAKEAVKVLNKEASAKESASAAEKSTSASPAPSSERKRGTANIKSMLQRDLGLAPAPNRRRGTKREVGAAAAPATPTQPETTSTPKTKAKEPSAASAAAAAGASEKSTPAAHKKSSRAERRANKEKASNNLTDRTNSKNNNDGQKAQPKAMPTPTILKKPQTPSAPTPPKGPAASRAPPSDPAAGRAPNAQSQAKAEPSTSSRQQAAAQSAAASTGKQAFLKHANPSQGITEPLIEEALKVFGAIEKVEIDKRKGFAYVEFADSEGLKKAIAASPVKVAQGAVQVLERKEKVVRTRPHPGPHGPPTGPARGGRGGFAGRGGRARGAPRGVHAAANAAGGSGEAPAAPATPAPAPNAAAT